MDLDALIARLEEIRAERGDGTDMIMVPSGTGGEYTPSDAYEFDGNIYIN